MLLIAGFARSFCAILFTGEEAAEQSEEPLIMEKMYGFSLLIFSEL